MENPINGTTVLKYPVEDRDVSVQFLFVVYILCDQCTIYYGLPVLSLQPVRTNCGVAVADFDGDASKNELSFTTGALITNISQKSAEW